MRGVFVTYFSRHGSQAIENAAIFASMLLAWDTVVAAHQR
ncbi:hypothetical protein ACS15_0449 [Ralstonia insidiosa]|uniref:Uncharacterized protein n=1 Tax=Ralstonia insidiosa TaxID=190721 RepID=A0AAC9BHL7_9RALS|nr:hypothetical protein ACS15_0449 [Ralstonia insidiosa]